jgi:hypothetical protein
MSEQARGHVLRTAGTTGQTAAVCALRTNQRRRRLAALAPVASIVAGLLLAACGSASSPAPSQSLALPSTTGSGIGATVGCPAASEVTSDMGSPFAEKSSQPFGTGVQCTYTSAAGYLDIDINPDSTTSLSASESAAESTAGTSVPGIGDWAYWLPAEDTFAALKGSTFVSIASTASAGSVPPESGFADLARQIL